MSAGVPALAFHEMVPARLQRRVGLVTQASRLPDGDALVAVTREAVAAAATPVADILRKVLRVDSLGIFPLVEKLISMAENITPACKLAAEQKR